MIELELKYTIPTAQKVQEMLADPYLLALAGEAASWKKIPMKAAYFDTADFLLQKRGAAFRIREEGERKVATMKFVGGCREGLHQREEINIELTGTEARQPESVLYKNDGVKEPDLSLFLPYESFRQTGIDPKKIHLQSFMQTDFQRHTLEVQRQDCCFELALDTGKILAGGKALHVLELEVEFFSGNEKTMLEIGETIRKKYGLTAENETKYTRGMKLNCQ